MSIAFFGRLDDDDQGAAEVGVTETTREPKAYGHPTNPKIKFWDLPGIGTPNYPHGDVLQEGGVGEVSCVSYLDSRPIHRDRLESGQENKIK